MKKIVSLSALAGVVFAFNSCCYCVVQIPDLHPYPYPWELEEVIDCDATDVIPSDK